MYNYLKDILVRLSIPSECHKLVLDTYNKFDKEEIDECLCQYEDENVEYLWLLNFWHNLEKKENIPMYIGDLVFSLLMCKKAEELYKKKGYSEELFIDTMGDIKNKVIECKLVKKEWGVFVADWFAEFFRLRLFKFGRLQFELAHFGFTYKDDKYDLNPYMRSVNVHISRTGERLDEEAINKSFDRAIKFLRPMFDNKPILFRFESWLYYSKTLEFLKPDSNIKKFCDRFIKFRETDDPDISEMWRLFDDSIDDLNRLKADTSLRKKYLAHLKSGGKIGLGFGFLIK